MSGARFAVGAILVSLLTLGTVSVGTAAAQVGCGATIATTTRLTSDVGPCPGDGLVVTGNGITLDLAGHRVFGTSAEGNSAGIRLRDVKGVTVRRGSVDNFDAGVAIVRGSGNRVQSLTVHDNDSAQFVADNRRLAELGDGIAVLSSSYNQIQGNVVRHNGPFSGIALLAETDPSTGAITGPPPSNNLISGNLIQDNSIDDPCPSSGVINPGTDFERHCSPGEGIFNEDIGLRVEGPGANHNTVVGNLIEGSGRDGVYFSNNDVEGNPPNTDNLVQYNVMRHNGFAKVVALFGGNGELFGSGVSFFTFFPVVPPIHNTVQGNTMTQNSDDGIFVGEGSTSERITENRAFDNSQRTFYFPTFDAEEANAHCDDNTWLDNSFGTVNKACVRGHTAGAVGERSGPAGAAARADSPRWRNPFHGPRNLFVF